MERNMDFHPDKVLCDIEFLIKQKLDKKDAERVWYIRHRLKYMGSICLTEENYISELVKQCDQKLGMCK